MAKKKTKSSFQKALSWTKTHWWVILLIIVVFSPVLYFASEKYRDWRNLEDIKELAGNIDTYKAELEEKFYEEYTVEVSCGTGGEKFREGNYCLANFDTKSKNETYREFLAEDKKCDYYALNGDPKNTPHSKSCVVNVREENKFEAENLFEPYSPEITWR